MLNQYLVTKQTGEKGRICNSVMVAERKFPRKEFYFAVMMERAFGGPVIIASSQGGVNIEEVAAENPDAIIYEPVDVTKGLSKETAEKVAERVGLGKFKEQTGDMLLKMYDLFLKKDALLIEINPYAEDAGEKCKYFKYTQVLVLIRFRFRFLPRRQIQVRRQRRIPSEGAVRPPRLVPGGREGGAGRQIRLELHRSGRQHRVHGERCRSGHGHLRHHLPSRWLAS